MFSGIAVNEYDPTDPDNDYTVSKPNEYYMKLTFQQTFSLYRILKTLLLRVYKDVSDLLTCHSVAAAS